jgi:hypothetical protein
MASSFEVGKRLLKYTHLTFFTYLLGVAGALVLLYLRFSLVGPVAAIFLLTLGLNTVLFVNRYRTTGAFDDSRLEFFCAFLPVLLTPLGSYFVGGFLMTLIGPPAHTNSIPDRDK